MPSADLICIGEAFDDLIFLNLTRLPRAGEEVRTGRFVATVGGGAVITAVAGSRLGLRTAVVSALSATGAARLRAERVRVVNLRRPDEPSAITAALSTRADRAFVTFDGVNDRLEARLLPSTGLPRAPFVHLALGPRHCRRWTAFVRRFQAAGAVVSWDFGWHDRLVRHPALRGLLAALDYVFVNEAEARLYTGTRTLAGAVAAWRRLARRTVIKLGPSGSRLIADGLDLLVPVRRRRAVDTTGAGDAFNGGFLYGLAHGLSPRDCLRAGNLVGAGSLARAGGLDGLPVRDDLPRALRR